jgi:TypA/BipA-like protein
MAGRRLAGYENSRGQEKMIRKAATRSNALDRFSGGNAKLCSDRLPGHCWVVTSLKCKEKPLTNMRSQGEGKGIQLEAPLRMTLERAIEYIDTDEYVEATPKSLRLRKRILDATARKRAAATAA